MKKLQENKVYTEEFLIRHFIKEYRAERNTNEDIYSYNGYAFAEFLEKKGFIFNLYKHKGKYGSYLYNPYLCELILSKDKENKKLKHDKTLLKDRIDDIYDDFKIILERNKFSLDNNNIEYFLNLMEDLFTLKKKLELYKVI